ncbi:hypothetical protein HQ314_00645 [Rhodococcus sp. BP-332]|uniref:sensor histidine kinase n=1 Tax=Rhodococcus sp. BP-332 TaxID=2739447 RepID=UPI001C9B691A|nr:histidine kinase [Rhodococcus sp. BP-332]MBY6675424.1 hypothetical protein [Rhodococcus sp. BP-332]
MTSLQSSRVVPAVSACALVILGSLAMIHGALISSGSRVDVLAAAGWVVPFPVAYVLGRPSAAWPSQLGLGVLAAAVGGVAVLGDVPTSVSAGVTYLVTVALPWCLGARHRRRDHRHRRRIESARLSERDALLRHMHDALGHDLAVIALHAGSLEIDEQQPPSVRGTAAQIREYATGATDRLRATLRHHHGDNSTGAAAETFSAAPSVEEMVRQARLTGTPVELHVDPGVVCTKGTLAHSVIREAVTNSHKHAPTDPVDVSVTTVLRRWRIVVTTRSPAPTATSSGLPTLARRVIDEGGSIGFGRDRDTGHSTVDALVPIVSTSAVEP